MANELRIASPGAGNNIYAILRRVSDGYVWQTTTSTFVAFVAADIANYDIPLTDQGGDFYAADFPTGMSAGTTLTIFYYEQASATPATPSVTDTILGTVSKTWDGDALAPVSVVTLSIYALTSLAAVKRFMRITGTGEDSLLTQMINAASARIESLAGRRFAARDYTEWLNGLGERKLVLHNYPIIHIDRVASGAQDALQVIYSGGGVQATAAVSTTGMRLRSVSTAGTATTTTLTFASYPTMALLATAISAVSGWAATALYNVASDELIPSALWSLKVGDGNSQTTFSRVGNDDIAWRIDESRGILAIDTFSRYTASSQLGGRTPRGWQNIRVSYRAGYETIPDDLAQICNEFVQSIYNLGRVNPMLASESIGDYSYSLAGRVELTDEQRSKIASYGEIMVGGRA